MRFVTRSLLGILLLALTAGLLALSARTVGDAVQTRMSAEPRAFPARERVTAVDAVRVVPRTLTPTLETFGEVRSARALDLRAPVGGIVIEVAEAFVEGGTVAEGTVLVRIDPAEAQTGLARARADLADAEAEGRDAQRALALAEDELAAAQSQADLQQAARDRQADLLDRGVGTRAALEAAEIAAQSARAQVLSRRQSLNQAQARIDQAATRTVRARLSVDDARRTLERTTVTAAFDGTLADVSLLPGGRVAANEQIARLIDPDALELSITVSTAAYARLTDGGRLRPLPVTATLGGDGGLVATGTLARASGQVAEGRTGRTLFADLAQAPGFRPGDFVTVAVEEPPIPGAAILPATALGGDGLVLAVGEDDRLEALPARLLRRQGDEVIVDAAGLEGRQVVARRSPVLGAGIQVRVVDGEAGIAPPPDPDATVALDPDRRARLLEFVEASPMPEEAKTRLRAELAEDQVPAATVARLEGRMGG
ncbi:MAG: efflux RND transporter periplasmic adaptor subunit [Paracoccaceae bacterium]